MADDYNSEIADAAARYGVDPAPLAAIAEQESGFNPNAANPSGARGIMQFMPATARSYGIDPTDPQQSIDAAARMFRDNLDRFGGDQSKAIAAHFGGPDTSKWGAKTRQYVQQVQARMGSAVAPPYRGDDSGNPAPQAPVTARKAQPWDNIPPVTPSLPGDAVDPGYSPASDALRLIGSGVGGVVSTAGQGMKMLGDATDIPSLASAGLTVRGAGEGITESNRSLLSPAMQAALNNPILNDDLSLGKTPVMSAIATTLEAVPSIATMAAPTGWAIKGAQAIGWATRLTSTLEKMGMTEEAAAKRWCPLN